LEIEINYPREKFDNELEYAIQEGDDLHKRCNGLSINEQQLKEYYRQLKLWNEKVIAFLKNRLSSPENTLLLRFKKINLIDGVTMMKRLKGENVNTTIRNYEHLLSCNQKQIDILVTLKNTSKYMPIAAGFSTNTTAKKDLQKGIFISHSSKDKKIVRQLINILEDIGVPREQIFCSSYEGYGVKLGDDFLITIKEKLSVNVLVFFILSENFYASPMCLCEMGATWIKTNRHIPIIVPPFNYKDVKGVIPTTNGMKINEASKYESLKDTIEEYFDLKPMRNVIWKGKIDNALENIERLLAI